jgi:copper chaperone NosL
MRAASRMSHVARALVLAAAVLLGTLYATPLWSVRLVAPQYPEGLGMVIRLNTIEGVKEHDLRNINALNHYIGMKPIVPDAIPELKYMPWIVAGLIAGGVLVAALGRRRLLVAWTVAFALLGAAGVYDFWRWSYDYGHNLDLENAVIVVPGMSYQPPLIGTKQLLNFTATSLPSTGGILAGVAMAFAVAAVFLSYRRGARLSPAALALAAACASGTPAIAFGADQCAECLMVVSDRRFGAVLVTGHGKEVTFDSIECLLKYQARQPDSAARAVWVVAAEAPGTLIPLAHAELTEDASLRPPMGTLVSFGAPRAR